MDDLAMRELFIKTGTIRKGHFWRLSGRHTDLYVQCARLFEDTATGALIGEELARRCRQYQPDVVLGAAVGGVLPGYETARAMNLPFLYCEKRDGALILRRGFELKPGQKVLIVEDEVSTGQSVHEMLQIVKALDGQTVAVACLVDKSGKDLRLGLPFLALVSEAAHYYKPDNCPMCKEGIKQEDAG